MRFWVDFADNYPNFQPNRWGDIFPVDYLQFFEVSCGGLFYSLFSNPWDFYEYTGIYEFINISLKKT